MVDFSIFSPGFYWTQSGSHGHPGQIPGISIGDRPLPPLNKVATIQVWILSSRDVAQSDLRLVWQTESGTFLILACRADDSRLKAQYKLYPDMAVKIIQLLASASSSSMESDVSRASIQQKDVRLSAEDVPTELQSVTEQIDVWREFMRGLSSAFSQLYLSCVTRDGYYVVHTAHYHLRWRAHDPTVEHSYAEWQDEFDPEGFDPKGQQPVIADEFIYWELPDKKIVVVLSHKNTSDAIATHYGYMDNLIAWREVQEQEKALSRASQDRMSEMMQSERHDAACKLAASLLSA